MVITLEDIEVMYIPAEGGPSGAREAFDKLESHLHGLSGRKFYGAYQAGEYRACVAVRAEDVPAEMGLATWVIPGGAYARQKVRDWTEKVPQVGAMFEALAQNYTVDSARPSIEYYRSQSELHLLLPILGSMGSPASEETAKSGAS